MSKLSQGSALQVMEKDKEWTERFKNMEQEHNAEMSSIRRRLEETEQEKAIISKNYESQMKMLSEHIVDLVQQNEKLKCKWYPNN